MGNFIDLVKGIKKNYLNYIFKRNGYRAPRDIEGKYKGTVTTFQRRLDKVNAVLYHRPYHIPRKPDGKYWESASRRERVLDRITRVLHPKTNFFLRKRYYYDERHLTADQIRQLKNSGGVIQYGGPFFAIEPKYNRVQRTLHVLQQVDIVKAYRFRLNEKRMDAAFQKRAYNFTNATQIKLQKSLAAMAARKAKAAAKRAETIKKKAKKAKQKAARKARQKALKAFTKYFQNLGEEFQDYLSDNVFTKLFDFAKSRGLMIERLMQSVGKRLTDITQGLIDLRISFPQWVKQFIHELRIGITAASILGAGGLGNGSANVFNLLNTRVEKAAFYFERFTRDIARMFQEGLVSAKGVLRRSESYIGELWMSFQESARRFLGDEDIEVIEERRITHSLEGCLDCANYEAMGWQPIGTLPEIGEDSECGIHCRCAFEYRTANETTGELGDEFEDGDTYNINTHLKSYP